MSLTPDDFWKLQPFEFDLMLEGLHMKREYERSVKTEDLLLMRRTLQWIINIGRGLGGQKPVDEMDVHPIPEIDKILEKQLKKREQERERKAEQSLEKYKRIEQRLKDG